MDLTLYVLASGTMKWPAKTTIANGRYVEEVVIWKVVKLPVIAKLGAANDND